MIVRSLALLAMACALAACGQKGDLYLPQEDSEKETSAFDVGVPKELSISAGQGQTASERLTLVIS